MNTSHHSFQSDYRPQFEVVEQRQGDTRLYPHTDQLPTLLRAINNEFHLHLPPRVSRVDQRGDGFHKIWLNLCATTFCSCINGSRSDQLRLLALVNSDLVAKVTIAQTVSESTSLGRSHRFRFYAEGGFFPEIYISGKRVAFSSHVLERFGQRVPNNVGEDLSTLLLTFYSSPFISMRVGGGGAFVIPYRNSILAFTYREGVEEFFMTTCLTTSEMDSLDPGFPPRAHNLHYGSAFTEPRLRNWSPLQIAAQRYQAWQDKTPLAPPFLPGRQSDWPALAAAAKETLKSGGDGPGSRICFLDGIPGPCCISLPPGKPDLQIDPIQEAEEALIQREKPPHQAEET
jgi:hypothetical protein